MKILSFVFFFTIISINTIQAQDVLAKIEYSEAEKSFQQKNYKETLKHLEKVKELLGSTNAKVMYLEIIALENSISISKSSLEDFEAFLKMGKLSDLYIASFETEVPIDKLKQVYTIKKEYEPYTVNAENLIAGTKAWNNEEKEKSLTFYKTACEAGNVMGCLQLSSIYFRNKDYENLKNSLEKGLELADDPNTLISVGNNYFYGSNEYVQDREKGLSYLKRAVEFNTKDALYYMGKAQIFLGKNTEAKPYLQKAIEKGDDNAALYYFFYIDYDDLSNIDLIKSSLDSFKESSPVFHNEVKGLLSWKEKKYNEAIQLWTAIAEKSYKASSYLYNIYNKGQGSIDKNRRLAKQYEEIACQLNSEYCN